MLTRLTALLCLLALCAPGVATAQSPFGATPSPGLDSTPAPTVTATTTTDDGNGGLKPWQTALIIGGGAILLLGIAYAIVSDARSTAPVVETESQSLSKARKEAEAKRRKEQARARDRRARASRKKNRAAR